MSKNKWQATEVVVVPVEITNREYHIRLDQLAEAVYTDLRQLSFISSKSVSSESISIIHANPVTDKTPRDINSEEEETYGAA